MESGVLGDHIQTFSGHDLLEESDSLLASLEKLRDRRWAFVRFLGDPSGIVTRGDLQKAPMRMWLFGLISLLEMQMVRCIRSLQPGDNWWIDLLPNKRIKDAEKILTLRKVKGEDTNLIDCLQIADKSAIFRKNERLFDLTGCSSRNQWKDIAEKIETLRNKLAHATDIGTSSWPEIAGLAVEIERILGSLERGPATAMAADPVAEAVHLSFRQERR